MLLGGTRTPLVPLFRRVGNVIQWINLYSVDGAVFFIHTYPFDNVVLPLKNWTLLYNCCQSRSVFKLREGSFHSVRELVSY